MPPEVLSVPETLTRTTLRLPAELHQQLKVTAAAQRTTSEAILVEAVRRELERRGATQVRTVAISNAMNPALAELFLHSMPTFALIKDTRARIVWGNLFVERTLDTTLAALIGNTITDLGFTDGIQRETILENIGTVLKHGGALPSKEGMNLKRLGKVTIRAQRYLFNGMLGDISFVEDDIKDASYAAIADALRRMQHTTLDPAIEELLVPFLEAAPVAIAVKRPTTNDSEIVWGNKTYLELIKKPAHKTFGHPTTKVLELSSDHPILAHEHDVVRTGRARMSKEHFRDHAARWSLRFPIHDHDGSIKFVGVVSPDFQQHPASRQRDSS